MKLRLSFTALLIGVVVAGALALAAEAKLPKCSTVKCRDLGCPAVVLCVSGAHV